MKRRILIIDDDADARVVIMNILESAGYEALESSNARDGIDLAVKEQPDLILLDIRLPYKSKGIGAANALRKEQKTRTIPIIFLSGYPEYRQDRSLQNISNSVFLDKSAIASSLLKYIEEYLPRVV